MHLSVVAKTILAAEDGWAMRLRWPAVRVPSGGSASMAGVVLENVSRVYPGGVSAVEGIRLEVRDREFLVLVGPSGCGKTTTLRLIAGLEDLSSGTITIGSRVVNDVPPKDRDIAMVFQNYALYPHLTVYRNLAFGLELREGISGFGWLWRWALPPSASRQLAERRFAIAERVHDAARILGIEDLLERYPRQLSGGERQRVALGRAIVRNPAVFLFDEPLSNLDAKLRVEMRRELKQLHQPLADDDDLRHARSGRSPDAGRANRGDERRKNTTGRTADGGLRLACQPLRCGIHRHAGHELHRGRADARSGPAAVSSAVDWSVALEGRSLDGGSLALTGGVRRRHCWACGPRTCGSNAKRQARIRPSSAWWKCWATRRSPRWN